MKLRGDTRISIQVNCSSFSPNGAVVTLSNSGWMVPGSNPWSMDEIVITFNEIHGTMVKKVMGIGKIRGKPVIFNPFGSVQDLLYSPWDRGSVGVKLRTGQNTHQWKARYVGSLNIHVSKQVCVD